MAAGIVIILLVILVSMVSISMLGVAIFKRARRVAPVVVPPATIANPEGTERAYAKAARAGKKLGAAGRHAMAAFGLTLAVGPWAFVLWVMYQLFSSPMSSEHNSKGRVLRIRNRAELPEVTGGTAWHGGSGSGGGEPALALALPVELSARRTVGELWLLSARMEHASIAAFSQLSLHLLALGAPAQLVADTQRAALDEIAHARACFAIASRLLGEARSAGPIAALAAPASRRAPDLVRLAVGSLVDGCLAEGLAADVAAHGAATAGEPTVRKTLAMIAADEARHAELGWDVLAWCLAEGGAAVRAAVAGRVQKLDREVTPKLPDVAGAEAALLRRYGVVDQDTLGELARARVDATRGRAEAMLRGAGGAHGTARAAA